MGPIFQAAFVALVSTLVGDSIPAQVEEGGIVPHCDILSVLEMLAIYSSHMFICLPYIQAICSRDVRTITASNLRFLANVTGLDLTLADKITVKNALPIKHVPESELWRLGLMDHLIQLRSELDSEESEFKRVVAMLSSLCTS